MIQTLSNIQPAMIVCFLAFFLLLESYLPYATHYQNRWKHTRRNLVLVLIAFLSNGLAGLWYAYWLDLIRQNAWGLLNVFPVSRMIGIILGLFLIDLDSYAGHIVVHKVPVFWRFHRVHHSDNELDSTSSLRFHPLEIFFQLIWRTITFALLGISLESFILFLTISIPLLFIQHANIRFHQRIEKLAGWVFVTSSWHKVHHSDEQLYTDSHYSNVFTIWDRIFGTHHKDVEIEKLRWGLKELNEDVDQTVKKQILLPFITLKMNKETKGEHKI
jgi:sterol desaturase/sphingolipid hydroxylase (fatty acid hydroxylase superfamily)